MAESKKYYLSFNDYLHDMWRLAAKVRNGGWRPDYILGLWRGGAAVAVSVHEFLKVSGWSVEHLPLKCASYSAIGENPGEVRFTHGEEIFGMFGKGDRVLAVDDVFDTGKTAVAVKSRIESSGAEMRMACVYWKPERNLTDMKPDYFTSTLSSWIVFPHEIEGLTCDEIREKDPFLAELLESSAFDVR